MDNATLKAWTEPSREAEGSRKPLLILAAVTLGALVPFLGKPFHIDDPLFLWIAQQIACHPLDPYGFTVNWSSFVQPMSEVMQNPPLCSYYAAAIGSVFGWSEIALHAAFLIPALAATLGTFAVARRLCPRPLFAALLTLFTPVFMISAGNVMCDVMLLAFWVMAIASWMSALEQEQIWRFVLAAALISAAALTKYFGIALVPLLFVYTLARDRRLRWPLLFLLLPIAILALYDLLTARLYGHGLFTSALSASASIAAATRPGRLAELLIALAFTGGCLLSTLSFLIFQKRIVLLAAALVLVAFCAAFRSEVVSWVYLEGNTLPVWLQGGLFATAAAGLLVLAGMHFAQRRDAGSILLLAWIFGTFVFAAFLNWSVTGRTILPLAPPTAILIVRCGASINQLSRRFCFALFSVLSLLLTTADFREAECGRSAARHFQNEFQATSDRVRFLGHWGFQYYMQNSGATPFDRRKPEVRPGDIIVGPLPDPLIAVLPVKDLVEQGGVSLVRLPYLNTSVLGTGAAFYSSFGGPLPWAINRSPPARYYVTRAR